MVSKASAKNRPAEEDITSHTQSTGESICAVGLRQGQNLLLFAGNTAERTTTTSLSVKRSLQGSYRLRSYNSLLERWVDGDERVTVDELERGIMVTIERRGFCVLDLQQEV